MLLSLWLLYARVCVCEEGVRENKKEIAGEGK